MNKEVTKEEIRALARSIGSLERETNELRVEVATLKAFVAEHRHDFWTGKAYHKREYA